MKYIIVDLEATCWETKDQKTKNEIIEIGAVSVNANKQVEGQFNVFVKPRLNPQLSDFCKKLTSITQADVDGAPSFPQALEKFQQWINLEENYVLCSWGFYDKTQFNWDCELHQLDTAWLKPHISLKHQYARIKSLSRPPGMKQALEKERLPLTGIHHRGIDDALNISRIFIKYFECWKYAETVKI
jgi:inhibitor of KinA sporulation pathway (predicted exonuclease)